MSKNEGGKYISSWYNIMIASFSNSSKLLGSIIFLQIALKNMHRRVIICLTFFGKIPRVATGEGLVWEHDNHEILSP